MKVLSVFLIFGAIGSLGARHTDIDINRIIRLPDEVSAQLYKHVQEPVGGKSNQLILSTNDYDDHSGRYMQPRVPPSVVLALKHADSKTPVRIYQPREDPRLYYQSDAYLKDYGIKNIKDVTQIYPGHNVVRPGEGNTALFSRLRSVEDTHSTVTADLSMCVKCPHHRTLIAKAPLGRVVLQSPSLQACSGRKAPRSTKFVHMYGPQFGSLLEQGSHMVIGRIMNQNKSLQLCKIQVHVIVQTCATPKYLVAHCWDHNKRCNFTCRTTNLELSGPATQTCGDDMRWQGELPVCRARTWCQLPVPPEHGRVSCQGTAAGAGGLAEGSRCRVRCAQGWRSLRTSSVCRRGAWTHALVCQPRGNVRNSLHTHTSKVKL